MIRMYETLTPDVPLALDAFRRSAAPSRASANQTTRRRDGKIRMQRDHLRRLYDAYADGVYRYLLQMSRSEETAFDLLQETFLRADRYYKEVENEKAWLYRIARNLFLDHRRKTSDREAEPPVDFADPAGDAFTDQVHWGLLRREILEKLGEANELYPRIFLMKLDHDLTQEEIAEILGSSARTIRRHFEKIKNFLLANFGDELFEKGARSD